jgi:hypothetical protein
VFGLKVKRKVHNREQLFINKEVQMSLLQRLFFYGIACLVYFVTILAIDVCMMRPGITLQTFFIDFLDEAIYWAPGLVMLGPVVAYDMLLVSNRFAGPMFSLERALDRLAKNESVEPIQFREEDHWQKMTESFNQIRTELLQYRELGTPEEIVSMRNSGYARIEPRERLFVDNDTADDSLDFSVALN